MSKEREAAAYDVIYLAGCAANSIIPDRERIKSMNPKGVYVESRFFSLSALSWYALESASGTEEEISESMLDWDPAVLQRWKEAHDRAFLRNVRFERKREEVYSFLTESGIRFMPLKGIVLQRFYPEPYLREMVDNDILFDAAYQEKVYQWFLERSYTAEDYKVGNCDAYHKKPIYNFEMHTMPFAFFEENVWRAYNESFFKRLIPDGKDPLRCHLSDEDFYVYLILHWYKHQIRNGIGVRSLLDCYLYTQAVGAGMDRAYIEKELSQFCVTDFEKRVRTLARKLFADPARFSQELLSPEERSWLEEFINSGTNGTVENRVRRGLPSAQQGEKASGRAKFRYVRHRLFPSAEYMTTYAPAFAKHKWLIPAGYVYRILRGYRKHGDDLRSEAKIIRKM